LFAKTPQEGNLSDTPITPDASAQDAPPAPTPSTSAPDAPKVFDAAYVEELRKENAKWRTQARKYESEREQSEAAKLSELEKAQKRAAELEERFTATERALRSERAAAAVMAEAGKYNLPAKAAARLITPDALEYDDAGTPKASSVRAALKALADDMPELTVQARTANPARGGQAAESDQARRQRLSGGGGLDIFDPVQAARLGGGVIFPTTKD
jgi:hypothetical protein